MKCPYCGQTTILLLKVHVKDYCKGTKWVPEKATDDGDFYYPTGYEVKVPANYARGSYVNGRDDPSNALDSRRIER